MGTTLTGTTPQDTYDSLIKVTDNGPLSGTAKYLSDGLGNDSVLALSNARVGVATTSPLTTLQVGNTTINNAAIGSSLVRLLSRSTANDVQEIGLGGEGSATMSAIGNIITDGGSFAKGAIYFATRDVVTNTAPSERMRITSAGEVLINRTSASGLGKLNVVGGADFTGGDVLMCRDTGNVGIGLSSPTNKLHVAGNTYSEGLYVATGQFTIAGSATATFYTFSNVASNRVFFISVRQSGNGANSVMGAAFTFSGSLGAYNIAQDNTNPVLFLTIGASGLGLTLTTASGYGPTTWEYTITQIK